MLNQREVCSVCVGLSTLNMSWQVLTECALVNYYSFALTFELLEPLKKILNQWVGMVHQSIARSSRIETTVPNFKSQNLLYY